MRSLRAYLHDLREKMVKDPLPPESVAAPVPFTVRAAFSLLTVRVLPSVMVKAAGLCTYTPLMPLPPWMTPPAMVKVPDSTDTA